jgi:hypothetical protein
VVVVVQDLHHQHLLRLVVLVVEVVEILPVEVPETLEDLLNQKEILVAMVDILPIPHNMMVVEVEVQVVQEQLRRDKVEDQEELVLLFLLQVLLLIMLAAVVAALVEDLQQLEELAELEEGVLEHQNQLDNQELQEIQILVVEEEEVLLMIVLEEATVVPVLSSLPILHKYTQGYIPINKTNIYS